MKEESIQLFENVPFIGIDFWQTDTKPGFTFHLYSQFDYKAHFDKRLRNATLKISDDKIEVKGESFCFNFVNEWNQISVEQAQRDGYIYSKHDIRLSFFLKKEFLQNGRYEMKQKEDYEFVVSANDNIYRVVKHTNNRT